MTVDLLTIGVQPSEIEAMKFRRLNYYWQCAKVMINANQVAQDASNG